MTPLARLTRVWAGSVYAAMVPVLPGPGAGATTFLEDLWREAPRRLALASTVGVLLIALSPPLVLGRLTLFHRLRRDEQERLLGKLLGVRSYPLRMLVFGVKSQALVAVLRDPAARKRLGWEIT
jgi:hypothetical protein